MDCAKITQSHTEENFVLQRATGVPDTATATATVTVTATWTRTVTIYLVLGILNDALHLRGYIAPSET